MAAISSGVARPAVSSITETRYCISDHLLWFGAPLVGGRSPLLRTPLPRSDTASRISFKTFGARVENDVEAIAGHLHRQEARPAAFARLRRTDLPIAGLRPLGGELSFTVRSAASMIQKSARYFSLSRWWVLAIRLEPVGRLVRHL